MPRFEPKLINKILSGWIKITEFTYSGGATSVNITSTIGSALLTAGEGGVAVSLLPSTASNVNGVIVTPPNNKVEVWDSATKSKIASPAGNEVYGKITHSSGIYSLSLYTLVSGIEQVFTFSGNFQIDFDFGYRFRFEEFPTDGIISNITRNVNQDTQGSNGIEITEVREVLSTNVLQNLSSPPSAPLRTKLLVFGKVEDCISPNASFSVSGTIITWNSSNAGYSLQPGDRVVAIYYV